MQRMLGLLLVLLGVIANNVVYLQDLWLGSEISLDSWRAYGGLLVSVIIILVGCSMMYAAKPRQ